jgi:hypothetical protein
MRKILALILVAALVISISPIVFAVPAPTSKFGAIMASATDVEKVTVKTNGDIEIEATTLGQVFVQVLDFSKDATIVNRAALLNNPAIKNIRIREDAGYALGPVTGLARTNTAAAGLPEVWRYPVYLEIEFAEELRRRDGEIEVSFDVRIRESRQSAVVSQKYIVELEETRRFTASKDDDVINVGNWVRIIEVDDNIRNAKIETENVTITTDLFRGRNVWLRVQKDMDFDSDDTMAFYRDNRAVIAHYDIDSLGINSTVKFDEYSSTRFQVYFLAAGEEGNPVHLGAGNVAFDMHDTTINGRYYIASALLDLGDDGDEPENEEDPWDDGLDNPEGGGDDWVSNVNDNPGTGR